MRVFLFSLVSLSLLSFSALAADVEGSITYKIPSGELVSRDITLNVPSMGQGEVVLYGKNFEWKTKDFFSYKKLGKNVFVAAFQTEFMNFKSTIVFKGTYMQGTNEIVYTGDFYKKDGHDVIVTRDLEGFEHQGVFTFNFDR